MLSSTWLSSLGMLWCRCKSCWCFIIVSSWGLQASSICNWVSFPPTELALALIYLRVQISPCLLLKASTSSQNLFLLLETVPPPLQDTHNTRAHEAGRSPVDSLSSCSSSYDGSSPRGSPERNSTPPLDSAPDLADLKGKSLSQATRLSEGWATWSDYYLIVFFFLAVCVCAIP